MAKTTKGEESKIKLIECAAKLFLQKGYNGTGINDILSGTGLPKGSFYFHFASKKDLAISVSEYFEKKLLGWIKINSKDKKWDEFIISLVGEMIKGAEKGKHYGCPFAVLGLEIAFLDSDISKCYYKSIKELIDLFASIFEHSGVPKDNIYILANRAFAIYEGYLVYYRIGKDINTLKTMQEDLIKMYEDFKEVK
ncbi:AcrR family transcriptional regulator [Clostridium acetobutylicum]|uniref:ThlR, HTH transcriptional regulator TetR/AcrR family n=2 Tax=Clostridium acetobutylicum TaxID=1488 RepID=Q7DFN0_CLOAB|nr:MULTISPECIES: TetR/AcrR family transcriptional regulator [Clostridium]AAC26025.1 ThlR [Clostridium acetobutylicum ATCC 824]AAK76825.1 ThlR, HTH transcriptional regulator TetR/AcrR family [Clostridium acetobutylicum ATCC 824]ADZ22861.1 ThlR, HTH transcriptional regulator TetR/AcrR family [Clostridium acetobutylicum EA 2018]AEI34821.1 TetR/AcrR family transcriptional regulator [Clostridium acetobutylicum DSM 1731]AWV82370.1 TetR/AcrR family transcriptional regulator [Clostridium acetobutylicu